MIMLEIHVGSFILGIIIGIWFTDKYRSKTKKLVED